MYHENKWYSLEFKKNIEKENILENLDINILNNYCLKPFLNIKDESFFILKLQTALLFLFLLMICNFIH